MVCFLSTQPFLLFYSLVLQFFLILNPKWLLRMLKNNMRISDGRHFKTVGVVGTSKFKNTPFFLYLYFLCFHQCLVDCWMFFTQQVNSKTTEQVVVEGRGLTHQTVKQIHIIFFQLSLTWRDWAIALAEVRAIQVLNQPCSYECVAPPSFPHHSYSKIQLYFLQYRFSFFYFHCYRRAVH